MNIFDLDKNSLPEQVQKNKENIATLMTDPTTKQYVDDQDAIMLQDAKDYADAGLALKQDKLTTSSVNDGAIEKNIGFDTDGNIVKQAPSTPTITASDVDSETATAGQFLAADGNGGASWQTVGGGGGISLTTLWTGSATSIPFTSLSDSVSNYKLIKISGLVGNDTTLTWSITIDMSNYVNVNAFIPVVAYEYTGGKPHFYNVPLMVATAISPPAFDCSSEGLNITNAAQPALYSPTIKITNIIGIN